MADPFAAFYSGSMLSPNRVGNQLVQAPIYGGPTSLSDMYRDILPNQGEGLTAHPVQPQVTAPPAVVDAATPLDVTRLGLTDDPFRPPALAAIDSAAPPTSLASWFDRGAPIGGDPGVTDWSKANPGDGGLFGIQASVNAPQQAPYRAPSPAAAPAPAAPPPTAIQTIAAMFKPAKTVGFNGHHNLTSNDLSGSNKGFGGQNALMPSSMNNSRWVTGY